MEMTISPVQLGLSSQPQAKASDTGFSDVLTEVRTAAPQMSDYTAQNEAFQGEISPEALPSEEIAAVTVIEESFSAEFESTVIQLVSNLSGGNAEENDRIISALLDILKRMQNNSEDDPAVNLAMELLAAMLGETDSKPAFEITFASAETTVTAVNTEITAILGEEAAPQQNAAEIPAQTDNISVQTAEVVQTAANVAPVTVKTEGEAETITQPQNVQTAENTTVQTSEMQASEAPADTYGKLLNEILAAAKKELGLTKAELVQPEKAVQPEAPVQSRQETVSIPFTLNRKDGTDELNSILGAVSDETADTQEIKAVPQTGEAAAVLTENIPQPTTTPVSETETKVEAPLPEQQLADEILSKPETIHGGRTEFTMELNPESLGKITVRLVSTEGRVEVNITAENDSTRQLLESRAENISAALKNNGVELERYQVVSDREEAQLMQESYDGSSKNPYGRNDENQQDEEHGDEFLEILQQL